MSVNSFASGAARTRCLYTTFCALYNRILTGNSGHLSSPDRLWSKPLATAYHGQQTRNVAD